MKFKVEPDEVFGSDKAYGDGFVGPEANLVEVHFHLGFSPLWAAHRILRRGDPGAGRKGDPWTSHGILRLLLFLCAGLT